VAQVARACSELDWHVQWVATTEMIADIFTKPLDKTAFLKHRAWLVFDPRKA
jgi:hypothetical protein